jgi:tetratricopeptide (TPR) repeat protein
MTRHCDKVELFVDGELPAEEAEAFRVHLPDCENCQLAMDRLMQLQFLAVSHVQQSGEQEEPVTAPSLVPPRRTFFSRVAALFQPERRPLFMAAAALAAVLIVVVWRQPFTSSLQSDVWLAQRKERLLEARVSYPAADKHRELAARSMGRAGSTDELPYGDLDELKQSDPHGLAAALLIRDDKGLAGRAVQALETLGDSPDLNNDRAVAKLLEGKHEEALRLLDAALEVDSSHPQALWNRGLVLREMGLKLLAARTFLELADRGEPGWSREAKEKAAALRAPKDEQRKQWEAISAVGKKLVGEAKAVALPQGFSEYPSARRHFYEAVRAAPSREAALALLPLAQEIDARAGGSVLAGYVLRVAEADFSRRTPLAESYARLLQGQLSSEENERFLAELLGAKEEDILLGAIVAMDAISRHREVFEAKAAASADPWFKLLVAQERAKADVEAGDWTRAIQTLREARSYCTGGGLEYRCMMLDRELTGIYLSLHQIELARAHAEAGWKQSRSSGEWQLESIMLWSLSEAARIAGNSSLARVYLLEFLEHNRDDLDTVRRAHQALAVMGLHELQVEAARREIDAALATGRTLGLPGVFALADISRMQSAPEDEQRLKKQLEELTPRLNPGEQLIARQVLGRFFIDHDVAGGAELLWRVIEEAEAQRFAKDSGARRARAYSFTSLIFAAGKSGDFQKALELFEREYPGELPRRCLLAATEDFGRTLVLIRDADGALDGIYNGQLREPLPQRLDNLVPESLEARLGSCEQVDVLARPLLHGRAGLLPSTMAWSYLTRTSAPRPQKPGPALHLVVFDVELPPDAPLERLNAWTPRFGPEEQPMKLSGEQATPSRVLAAMKHATEIDLVAHGILNDFSDASYLLLAPEPGGPELGISKVRTASLQGAPFVVLAACHAAHTSYAVDTPLSLPAAFIEAGARGVLAATVEIPDREAEAFFNAVREQMRAGKSPAQALRDERQRWLNEQRGAQWIDSILLFE